MGTADLLIPIGLHERFILSSWAVAILTPIKLHGRLQSLHPSNFMGTTPLRTGLPA